jgi:hypothetical protein
MQFATLPGPQAAARLYRGKEQQRFAQLTNQFTQLDVPWDGQWERNLSIREDRFPDGAENTSCSTGNLARKVRRFGISLPNSESFCPKNNCGKAPPQSPGSNRKPFQAAARKLLLNTHCAVRWMTQSNFTDSPQGIRS